MVDDSAHKLRLQPDNLMLIPTFDASKYHENKDNLLTLMQFMSDLARDQPEDVRPYIRSKVNLFST
jgi:hypothetical protein